MKQQRCEAQFYLLWQQEAWTLVAVSGKERIWQDGGQRPTDRYRHLEKNEQVEVGSKEWIDLSGKERMEVAKNGSVF